MSVITWVTDPYLPVNTPLQTRVQSLLQQKKPIMSTLTVLERTITRYLYFFSELVEYPPELTSLLYSSASLSLRSIVKLPGDTLGALITLVKNLATRYLRVRVDSVTVDIYLDPTDDRNFIYIFTPLLKSGELVYRTPEELYEFISIPLETCIGWKLLSADPLTPYLLTKPEYQKFIYRDYQGVYLVDLYENVDQFQQELYFLNLRGIFQMEPIPEGVANSFGLTIISPGVYSGSDGIFTEDWLKGAMESLDRGILPSILLAGPWQTQFWTSGNEGKLILSLVLSYLQLSQTYPELKPYLPLVGVTKGLDLRVNISNKIQIKNLLDSFTNWLATSSKWKVHPVDSLRQGVALRVYYQEKGVYLPSLIVNRTGRYFVILAVSEPNLLPEIDDRLQEIYTGLPAEIEYNLESSGLISGYGAKGIVGDKYLNRPIPTSPRPEKVSLPVGSQPSIMSPRESRRPRRVPMLMKPSPVPIPFSFEREQDTAGEQDTAREQEKVRVN